METKSLRNLPQEIDQWWNKMYAEILGRNMFQWIRTTKPSLSWLDGILNPGPLPCAVHLWRCAEERSTSGWCGLDLETWDRGCTKSLQRFAHWVPAAIIAVSCNPINRIGINCINCSNVVHCHSMYKVSMSCRPFLERVWTWRYVLRDDSRHHDRAVELADKAYVRLSDYSIKHPEKVTDHMKLD